MTDREMQQQTEWHRDDKCGEEGKASNRGNGKKKYGWATVCVEKGLDDAGPIDVRVGIGTTESSDDQVIRASDGGGRFMAIWVLDILEMGMWGMVGAGLMALGFGVDQEESAQEGGPEPFSSSAPNSALFLQPFTPVPSGALLLSPVYLVHQLLVLLDHPLRRLALDVFHRRQPITRQEHMVP